MQYLTQFIYVVIREQIFNIGERGVGTLGGGQLYSPWMRGEHRFIFACNGGGGMVCLTFKGSVISCQIPPPAQY